MERTKTGSDGTIFGIQALRAIAALVVVYGHTVNLLHRDHAVVPAGLEWLPGATGVDLFFVISGFVIAVSVDGLLRKVHPVRVFLWRRVMRVVPLYWLLTAAKLLAVAVWPALSAIGVPSVWNAIASFLFLPSLNPAGEIRPVIPVGWTLNFEALFYVAFAVALLRREGFRKVLLPLTCALGAIGLLRPPTWPVWTALADPIIFEFAAGVAIAAMVKRGAVPGRMAGAALLGAGALGLALVPPALATTAMRPVVWGVPAVAAVCGCVALEPVWRRRLPGWLLLLGSASYAIYLIQTFALPGVGLMFRAMEARGLRAVPGYQALEISLGVAVTALAGLLTHVLLERPMTEALQRRFGAERIAPIVREAGRA